MALGLLGLKVGMAQVYENGGKIGPDAGVQVGTCAMLQIRNQERDKYDALQLGFQDKARRKATKPERGHVSANLESKRRQARAKAGIAPVPKADCEPQKYIREFRLDQPAAFNVGQVLTVAEIFKDVVAVDVIGTSKGRGTTGSMKRHNFHGLPASHGVKKHHRSPGSVGSHASNRGSGRPKRGKRMAGRYCAGPVTSPNLRVVRLDADNHVLLVEGAVPGPHARPVPARPPNHKPQPPPILL